MTKITINDLFYLTKSYIAKDDMVRHEILNIFLKDKEIRHKLLKLEDNDVSYKLVNERFNNYMEGLTTPYGLLLIDKLEEKNSNLKFLFDLYLSEYNLLEKGTYFFDKDKKIGFNRDGFILIGNEDILLLPFNSDLNKDGINDIVNSYVEVDIPFGKNNNKKNRK